MPYYIYIISNQKRTTFYTGITNNIQRRIFEHKNELIDGFSKKYKLHDIVYYEIFDQIKDAIAREKQLKNWH